MDVKMSEKMNIKWALNWIVFLLGDFNFLRYENDKIELNWDWN